MPNERKSGKSISIRPPDKLRYIADLAARKDHRSFASFAAWALSLATERVSMRIDGELLTMQEVGEKIWTEDPLFRFIRLSMIAPSLHIEQERILWKAICNMLGWLPSNSKEDWPAQWEEVDYGLLRVLWDDYKTFADGQWPESVEPFEAHVDKVRKGYEKGKAKKI